MPHTLPALLSALTTEPGRPRLTWYGGDGERIELSGAVLVNWVSKTTNLLVEEFDAEPGTVVATDLPPHWRTLVWALATWRSGATLRLADASEAPVAGADVVVTADPDRWTDAEGRRPRGTELVAVALPALARSFGAELPAGTIDSASAVMTYGDQLGYVGPADDASPALVVGGSTVSTVSTGDLVGWALAARGDGVPEGARVLVTAAPSPTPPSPTVPSPTAPSSESPSPAASSPASSPLAASPLAGEAGGSTEPASQASATADLLATALAVWALGGSVVVLSAEIAAELAADPARAERLRTSERVTWTASATPAG